MRPDRTPVMLGVILAALVLGGLALPQWLLFILTIACAQGLVVLGLMLLMRAGLVSFGQALYYCIGAYTAGGLARAFGVSDLFAQMLAGTVDRGARRLRARLPARALPRHLLRAALASPSR